MRFRLPVDQFVSSLSGLPIQFHDKASSDEFCQRHRQFLVFVANSRCASQREHTSRLLVIAGSSINDDHSFPKRMFLLLSDDPLEEICRVAPLGMDMVKDWSRKVSEVSSREKITRVQARPFGQKRCSVRRTCWLLTIMLPMVRPIVRIVMVTVMVIPVAVFTVIVTIVGMPLSYGNGNRLRFRRNQSEEP